MKSNVEIFERKWDLESIFPGGSESETLKNELSLLESAVGELNKEIEKMNLGEKDINSLAQITERLCQTTAHKDQMEIFAGCLQLQDTGDIKSRELLVRIQEVAATINDCIFSLSDIYKNMNDNDWMIFIENPIVKNFAFSLNEARVLSREFLGAKEESLINALSVNGFHAWFGLYKNVVGNLSLEIMQDGTSEKYSVGQLNNLLASSDMKIRHEIFPLWEGMWAEKSDIFSGILNNIAGYRLALIKKRKWDSILRSPLRQNRMNAKTLDAMWDVVEKKRSVLAKFINRKAEILAVGKLEYCDLFSPLPIARRNLDYNETAHFIIEQFNAFDSRMGEFARTAFMNRWIESEDRRGKDPGACSADLPLTGESRIFMTFDGAPINRTILAHELGHAYHGHVLKDMPYMLRSYPMNLAETASIFAEEIISDAAMEMASGKDQKISLLHDRILRAVSNYMGVYSNFLFETRFYEERNRKSLIHSDRLCELMVNAQEEAFLGTLKSYNPYGWCSKSHFYFIEIPFYNFPYTFGYMFSRGVYAMARENNGIFGDNYYALLRDTGSMSVELLAQKHLGKDLGDPDFWLGSAELVEEDINIFLNLSENYEIMEK